MNANTLISAFDDMWLDEQVTPDAIAAHRAALPAHITFVGDNDQHSWVFDHTPIKVRITHRPSGFNEHAHLDSAMHYRVRIIANGARYNTQHRYFMNIDDALAHVDGYLAKRRVAR